MKAKFALDLTNDAVALLERDDGGWLRLGNARFDDPDLEDQLAALRDLAEARAPTGFVSKLIIPNSQILYFDCQVTGPDQATRRAEIRATLDGRTPYRVDELVFDFSRAGERARVAVAAKVTLEEAEDFARAYGFRPIAHVAAPEPGHFAGEPFFGLVPGHEELLPEGARFDRDQDPVRIAGDLTLAPTEAEGPSQAGPIAASPPAVLPPAAPEAQEAPFIAVSDDDEGVPSPQPVPDGQPTPDPIAMLADPAPDEPVAAEDTRTTSGQSPAEDDAAAVGPADAPVRVEPAEDTGTAADPANQDDPAAEVAEETPPTLDAAGDDLTPPDDLAATAEAAEPLGAGGPVTSQADASGPEADAIPAFQSRRDASAAVETATTGDEAGARLAAILPRLGGLVGGEPSGRGDPVAAAPSTGKVRRLTPGRVRLAAPRTLAPRGGRLPAGLMAASRSPRLLVPLAAVLFAGLVLTWALLPASAPDTPPPAETAIAAAPPSPIAPAPGPTGPESAAAPPPRPVDLPVPTVPASAPTAPELDLAASDDRLAALPGPSASDAAPTEDAPQMPAPANDPSLGTQPPPPPFGALLRYGADGLIVATEEGVVTPDGFLLVAGRPPRVPPARPDNLVPPPAIATEAAAVLPGTDAATPPPFADPALAGKPPRVRPADLSVPEPTAPPDESALPATGQQEALAALGPPVDPRHAALKPKPRPEAVAAAAAARLAQDEALADAAASAARAEAEAAEAALQSASRLAVASSRQPAPRSDKASAAAEAAAAAATAAVAPSVDASAVDAALAEAQTALAEPAAQEPPAPEAAAQDVDEPEPEPEDGIATMPTTRTVAKKSTFANAIDLEEVQLIGVYGSSASRRALVRMPSGGYKKVKLGDRLDGGRVVAIGTNELVYEKKGRTIRLVIMGRG